jgi:hypothetical protein
MKRALCIILCLFLASCAPTVAPTPTPAPTATATATPTSTATPRTPSPTPTATPQPTSTFTPTPVTWSIEPYLERIDPGLRQQIVDTFLADGIVSARETSLLRALTAYPREAQQQIVSAGLIDERYPARDPNRVLKDLATPYIIVFYLDNYFSYKAQWPVIYVPASIAIAEGKGGCIRYAQIAAEALRMHGYPNSWNMGIDITSEQGHNVAVFQNPADGLYYVITNGTGWGDQQGAVLLGPYNSIREAGEDIERRGYAPRQGDFRLLDPSAIKGPRGDILDFPWLVVP